MSDYILIEYSNSVDLDDIIYHNSFENRIYIDADVSKPEYEIEEDGVEDSDGEFDPTWQRWAKKYTLTFYAQEFLVDALTLMSLHDQIYVTLKNGEGSKVLDIEIDYTWDSTIECWAEVVIKFTTDYVVKRNCDEDIGGCLEATVSVADAHDADDGSTGEDAWNGDGIGNGDTAFFYTATTGDRYIGTDDIVAGFYRYNGSSWDIIELDDGDFGEITSLTDCVYVVKDSIRYYKVPYITSVTDNGDTTAKIKAATAQVESQFFQVQYDNGGWQDLGDPELASAFIDGVDVSCGVGTWDFRLKWYSHTCEYGTGNEVTKTIVSLP